MSLKDQFDVRHPIMRPFWRRAAFSGAMTCWAGVELFNGNTIWAALFGAASAYLIYEFFVVFDPANYGDKGEDE